MTSFTIDPTTGHPVRQRNFHQRLATNLNWYLFMLLGARSTVCGHFIQTLVTQREHNYTLTSPQRHAMNELQARASRLDAMMAEQEAAIRAFQFLPKGDL